MYKSDIFRLEMQRLFHVFYVKRKAVAEGATVIMPEKQNRDFSFLTREGFDMESFRYSGNRPGDDPGETYDIREYQPGDSIRQIHWKLSGKLDDIMIREKSFPVDDTVLILAEAFQTERDSKRAETVAEVLSAVLRDFMERKSRVRLEFMTEAPVNFGRKKSGRKKTTNMSCMVSCDTEVTKRRRLPYRNILRIREHRILPIIFI